MKYILVAVMLLLVCAGTVGADGFTVTYPPDSNNLSLEVGCPENVEVRLKNGLGIEVAVGFSDNAGGTISVSYPTPLTMSPGEKKNVTLTIHPHSEGDFDVAVYVSVKTPGDVSGTGGAVLLSTTVPLRGTVVSAPEFVVENLSISPEEVGPGEEVTISVDVANIGGAAGSTRIELKINGELIDQETVYLEPGESTKVSFTVAMEEEGSYSVEVDGLTGSFKVVPVVPPAEEEIPWHYVIIAVVAIGILGVLVYVIKRHRG